MLKRVLSSSGRRPTIAFLAGAAGLLTVLSAPGTARADGSERVGPFMANVKLGAAIGVTSGYASQFALQLEGGYEVIPRGYVTFSPQFQFGDFTTIILPAGFQYELELPVKNLYVYPQVSLGVGIAVAGGQSQAAFHLAPVAGAKYYFHDRFYAGLEPLGFQFEIQEQTAVQYRLLGYAGANF